MAPPTADPVSYPLKTTQLPAVVGRPLPSILGTIRNKLEPKPPRDYSGHWLWWPEDIERLRAALTTDHRRKEFRRGVARAS
jgi:hypothetical protein